MWLNEGWTCFNESMYQDKLYGRTAYNDYARTVHYQALRFAPPAENGYIPLSPMVPAFTYGTTTYQKGACVAHSLRSFLGDSLFFNGLQTYIHDYSFSSASSDDFKNSLSKTTGIDLTGFFNDWVYSAGWPHFEMTGQTPDALGYPITVTLRDLHNTGHYAGTPLEITWFDAAWKKNILNFNTGNNYFIQVHIPKAAIFAGLDMDGKITDATTKGYQVFKSTQSYTFNEAMMKLAIDSVKDSALVYIVHHWIAPERTAGTPKNISISSDRYWTVDRRADRCRTVR